MPSAPPPQPRRSHLLLSFVWAFRGIAYGLRTQRNLRIHVIASAIALSLAVFLRFPPEETAIVALLCGAVIAAELVNTAIEAAIDLISPEQHPLAGAAKDAAAGAVLVLAATAVIVGWLLYAPRLLALVQEGWSGGRLP